MFQDVAANYESYMSLLATRQRLVASNIANVDTPGYHTQDIDFRAEFDRQTHGQESGLGPRVIEAQGLVTKADGNNVNLDREARLLAENAMRFQIASTMAKGYVKHIKAAINEGKS